MTDKKKRNAQTSKKSGNKNPKKKSQAVHIRETADISAITRNENVVRSSAEIINIWMFPMISIAVASVICAYIVFYMFKSTMDLGNSKWAVFAVVFIVWLGYVISSVRTIRKRQKVRQPEEEIW